VSDRDSDTALTLFWRLIDLIECAYLIEGWILVMQYLGNRSSKSGLTVVDVPDGTDVYVRFIPLELRLCHFVFLVFLLISAFC
jgi:hypothetical protein